MANDRTSVVLTDQDREYIKEIKNIENLDNDSSAIRWAIRQQVKRSRKKLLKQQQS